MDEFTRERYNRIARKYYDVLTREGIVAAVESISEDLTDAETDDFIDYLFQWGIEKGYIKRK